MTDTTEYGLGAIESPPDPRDYPIAALYASLGIEPAEAAALAARYVHAPMPVVLNQHATPQCVAFSAASEQMAFDQCDQHAWYAFDEGTFFSMIGGGPGGADVRVALGVRKATGYPTVGRNDAGSHRIAAYYTVPKDALSLKQAIYAFGPLVFSTPWANSWFHPGANGVLPAPSGGLAGGHALVAYGWDDAKGLLLRNSWGAAWGVAGDAFLPYSQIGTTWSWWRAVDVIDVTKTSWTIHVVHGAVVEYPGVQEPQPGVFRVVPGSTVNRAYTGPAAAFACSKPVYDPVAKTTLVYVASGLYRHWVHAAGVGVTVTPSVS